MTTIGDRPRAGAAAPRGALPAGLLRRIRALLAKAEATTFEDEATAFTAKAQELMARYRVERAVVDATGAGPRDQPAVLRIEQPKPYADAKAVLLATIAAANGCRAVWDKDLRLSIVFGFGAELAAVDALFTSLLTQATAALQRHGSKRDCFGTNRTKRFRRSFLTAFAVRIGQRLHEAVDAAVECAGEDVGVALVPLLAGREKAARLAADAAFPATRPFAPTVSDGEGWYAGRVFADQIDLSRGPKLDRRSA